MNHSSLLFLALSLSLAGCDPVAKTEGTATEPAETEPAAEPAETEPAAGAVTNVDAAAAADLVDENDELIVVDVRTAEEFAEGHIQGALNLDIKAPGFRDEVAKLDPSKEYLLHCRSGARSTKSLPVFEELGFKKIHHLDTGFNAWKEAGNAFVTE